MMGLTMWKIFLFLLIKFVCDGSAVIVGDVIFAVNAGGKALVDSAGISYKKDPLEGKIGIASDYGRNVFIREAHLKDQELYQTERYHRDTFGYEIPLKGDGEYLILFKFCEVYFNAPNKKVFDVVFNRELKVITGLDIFREVGRGVAHDIRITFSFKNNYVFAVGGKTLIKKKKLRVEFVKGRRDNPKINAFYAAKVYRPDVFKDLFSPKAEDLESNLRKLKSTIRELKKTYGGKNTFVQFDKDDEWLPVRFKSGGEESSSGERKGGKKRTIKKPSSKTNQKPSSVGDQKSDLKQTTVGKIRPSKDSEEHYPVVERKYEQKPRNKLRKRRRKNRRKAHCDPDENDESYIFIILFTMGACIPIIFRYCKI